MNAQQMTTIRKKLACQSSISTRTKWRHKKKIRTHSNKRNEKAEEKVKEMYMLKANNSERWKVMIFLIFVFACFPNKYHFWMFHCLNSNLFFFGSQFCVFLCDFFPFCFALFFDSSLDCLTEFVVISIEMPISANWYAYMHACVCFDGP